MIRSSQVVEELAAKRVFVAWGPTVEICRPPDARNNPETFWAALLVLNLIEQTGGDDPKNPWLLAVYPDRVVIAPKAGFQGRMDILQVHEIQWDGFGTLQDWAKGGAR